MTNLVAPHDVPKFMEVGEDDTKSMCMGPIILNFGFAYARPAWPTHPNRIS